MSRNTKSRYQKEVVDDDDKQRTLKQNAAIHLYFQKIAEVLNDAGLDMRKVLKPEVHIPWTKQTVKDFLWRPVQELMVRKESTTELERKEIDPIFDTVNRHLAKFGVKQPFPSVEALLDAQREEEDRRFSRRFNKK